MEQIAPHQLTSGAGFYRREPEEIQQTLVRLRTLEQELEWAYQRWEALEQRRGG